MDSEFSNGLARPHSVPAPTSNDPVPAHDACAELIARLGGRQSPFERYKQRSQIGEGAMGQIFKAQDEDLHRDLAMKVMKPVGEHRGGTPRSPSSSREVARFVEEAQITGQLDHPGIVPVHELGLDPEGRLYFTMKLVRGRTLREVFDLAWKREEGWSTTRVLGVLLKVCEAMSYAHEHRVIHRDLKPGNIMVGRFGEVFVMDWGLARLLDKPDVKDIRVREEVGGPKTAFLSERHEGTPATPDSPLMTMDGDVIGTPAYMSPEQASGHADKVGIQTDVYAIGAILYHLLTRRMPYVDPGVRADNYAVWRWLQQGPPTSVEKLAPHTPAELVATCEKAMARELTQRYAGAGELAEDLRAYLENRVVRAHRTGAAVELRKWVARNRAVAASLVLAILSAIAVATSIAIAQKDQAREAMLSGEPQRVASLTLSAKRLSAGAPFAADELHRWLVEAREVVGRSEVHERRLSALLESARAKGSVTEAPVRLPADRAFEIRFANDFVAKWEEGLEAIDGRMKAGEIGGHELQTVEALRAILPREIAFWRSRAEVLTPSRARGWIVESPRERGAVAAAESLLDEIEVLAHDVVPRIEARLELALALPGTTLAEAAADWEAAIRSIRDESECALYRGMHLSPQVGLVPLRRDPSSGLWEFWHVASGDRPVADGNDRWGIGPDTGIVLVLIPGGDTHIGSQSDDPQFGYYDLNATSTAPLTAVDLDPYFISKYEMTQGQWARATGTMPSAYYAGDAREDDPSTTRSNPVESVSWLECEDAVASLDLALPTEARWEHAARALEEAPYPCGSDPRCLEDRVNHADLRLSRARVQVSPPPEFDDGFALHAPVGSYPPNAFGLHEMLGNVGEWCADWYAGSCDETPPRRGDGLREPAVARTRSYRGGHFKTSPPDLRVPRRSHHPPAERSEVLGLRPCRSVL